MSAAIAAHVLQAFGDENRIVRNEAVVEPIPAQLQTERVYESTNAMLIDQLLERRSYAIAAARCSLNCAAR